MTDPKLKTDKHRNRANENRSGESRKHSMTSRSQAERFRQRRAKDWAKWTQLFDGMGVEWVH